MSGFCCVCSEETAVPAAAPAPSPLSFARPKSSRVAPALVSMMFAGLQVPVHDPLPVRLVEPIRDLDRVAQARLDRQRSLLQPLGERRALQVLHHQEIDGPRGRLLAPDVVERADVRDG